MHMSPIKFRFVINQRAKIKIDVKVESNISPCNKNFKIDHVNLKLILDFIINILYYYLFKLHINDKIVT